jgi:hypothetical protein
MHQQAYWTAKTKSKKWGTLMNKQAADGARELIFSALEMLNGLNQVQSKLQTGASASDIEQSWKSSAYFSNAKLQAFQSKPSSLKKDIDRLNEGISKIGSQGPSPKDLTAIQNLIVIAQNLMNDAIWSLDAPNFQTKKAA